MWKFIEKWEKKYSKKISAKISNINISELVKNEKQNAIKNIESIATRNSSEKILSVLTQKIPNLIGGSADLTGSNNTKTKNHKIIKATKAVKQQSLQ